MEEARLDSRYKDVNTIFTPINDSSGIIISNGNYTRTILSEDKNHIQAVDFEGGPMISVGSFIGTKKVKSIKSCYYVELE